jgi:hypothetical protein
MLTVTRRQTKKPRTKARGLLHQVRLINEIIWCRCSWPAACHLQPIQPSACSLSNKFGKLVDCQRCTKAHIAMMKLHETVGPVMLVHLMDEAVKTNGCAP